MRHSLCLWLALALLFGALLCGNPFLPCRNAAPLAAPAGNAPVRAQPAVFDAGRQSALAIGSTTQAGGGLLPAMLTERRLVPMPTKPSGPSLRAPCPDPDVEAQVVEVEVVDNTLVWVLRDGRRLRRNPLHGSLGAPLLIPFETLDK